MKNIIALLVLVGIFKAGDATISEWTTPPIDSAANGSGTLSVAEDQALNTTITTYNATTNATTVTYSLVAAVAPFAVATTGELTITAALDFETNSSYTLEIQAVDDASPQDTGTATIAVTVTDVNEAPAFAQTTYTTTVADSAAASSLPGFRRESNRDLRIRSPALYPWTRAPPRYIYWRYYYCMMMLAIILHSLLLSTSVFTASATDQDTGDTITHSIAAGDTNDHFVIDSSTGVITVNSNVTFVACTTYVLQIKAADDESPAKTGTATINVTVTPCSGATMKVVSTVMILFAALLTVVQ